MPLITSPPPLFTALLRQFRTLFQPAAATSIRLRPVLMKHVRLLLLVDELPQASLALAETAHFHPDMRLPIEQQLQHAPGRDYHALYQQARSRLEKILKVVPLAEAPSLETPQVVTSAQLQQINTQLGDYWQDVSHFEEQWRRLDEQEAMIREQEAALDNFANLQVDLTAFRRKTQFLNFYVGLVPRANVARLEDALQLADHVLFNYLQRDHHAHVIIVGPADEHDHGLPAVLNSANFQPLTIPAGVDGRDPAQQQAEFTQRRAVLATERQLLNSDISRWSAAHQLQLRAAQQALWCAEPFVTLDAAIRGSNALAVLAGWVPATAVTQLTQRLQATLQLPFQLDVRDPLPAERHLVPTVPTRHPWLQPFATLVKQYGIPQYGEIDPTPLFAVTFLLMFGMMFGDVGHGAIIAGAAWYFRTQLQHFSRFGIAIGISSMVFGVIFGSVFGYEDWLPALWMAPLHDPILMLKVALVWGIGFILLACGLGIYNRIAIGHYQAALLAPHGVVNLVFYLGFLAGGWQLAQTGHFGSWPTLLVTASLLTLASHQWQHLSGPTGERLLIVVIETLDTVIVYLSNTLSFLRVSAFSLNHAALAIAIFTLADMLGVVGTTLTLILGNVFILVLEGGIVMIQVMRLQYYEGFSRYFSGDGHEFAPLRLRQT